MTQDDPLPRTLGERLDLQGRRLTTRLHPTLPWAGSLRVFMDHAAGLVVGADRFERIECGAEAPAMYTAPPAVRGRHRHRHRHADSAPDAAPPAPAPSAPVPPGRPKAEDPTTQGPSAAPPPTGRALPAPVRSRLRAAVGPAADVLRVHDDDRSDAFAREQRADAVTVGRDVHFRRGRLRPSEPSGFGLLVHEATHVLALLRPGASWQRATGAGARAEEAEALANERAVTLPGRPGPAASPVAPFTAGRAAGGAAPALERTATSAPAPVPTPTAHPRRAPADRHTDGPAAPPPLDVQALRRQVIDDVMRQLRSEFERGG
ncbi:eCIS core domain-containing protein [Streptomyces massasporeus]|uniref:eCIS core domain-containing protein n=1 Tax=Streptomyces massasporeus TaxID=67324 RepID=UPI0036B88699